MCPSAFSGTVDYRVVETHQQNCSCTVFILTEEAVMEVYLIIFAAGCFPLLIQDVCEKEFCELLSLTAVGPSCFSTVKNVEQCPKEMH